MFKKRNLIFICLFVLGVLFLSGCLPKTPITEGILKGQVIVPEGYTQTKDLTGQALPDATVNIIDLTTGDIIATTTTDTDGYYQVFVPAGGPYLMEAIKDGVKVQQITPPVEAAVEYDLGTANCSTTAVALIAQEMMDAEDYPNDPADINLTDIAADPNFDDVVSIVCSTIEAGVDPTESTIIQQVIEDFLYPPELTPTPTPTPTYTVTFDSQGGSAVISQTVSHGGKVTEPTDPTRTTYTFDGWYKESGCTNAWDFANNTVTTDITLYAKWISLNRYVSKSGNNADDGSVAYPWLTIQYALDNTPDGGTIHVADGTYTEHISFPIDRVIVLKSENGASSTTIDGGGSSRVVGMIDCPDGIVLDGFTIIGGYEDFSGGIYIHDSSPTIQNNIIMENTVMTNGGGIYMEISSPTIQDNIISGNNATQGGGIYVYESSSTIQDNIISGNNVTGDGGGIWISNSSSPEIKNNTFLKNTATNDGGAVCIFNDDLSPCNPTIQNNTISDNMANISGGAVFIFDCSPIIQNNTISENDATSYGGGIFILTGLPTIGGTDGDDTENFNTFINNSKGGIPSADQHIRKHDASLVSVDCHMDYPNNFFTPGP